MWWCKHSCKPPIPRCLILSIQSLYLQTFFSECCRNPASDFFSMAYFANSILLNNDNQRFGHPPSNLFFANNEPRRVGIELIQLISLLFICPTKSHWSKLEQLTDSCWMEIQSLLQCVYPHCSNKQGLFKDTCFIVCSFGGG